MRVLLNRLLTASSLLVVLCGATASSAWAQAAPCAGIGDDPRYQQILVEGAELARGGEHAAAVAKFEEALSMCAYDPIVSYYIGRAHQLMGECDIAIAMYKQAESQRAAGYVATPLTAERIASYLEEAVRTCRTVARYEIACAEPDVMVQLGDRPPMACPLSGETDAGNIALVATREGYRPHSIDVALVAGQANTVTVPALVPEGPTTGILSFTCSGGLGQALLSGPELTQVIACGSRTELAPGTYAVEHAEIERRAWVEIAAGREVDLRFDRPLSPATDGTFRVAGWSLVGSGLALAAAGSALVVVAHEQVAEIDAKRGQPGYTFAQARTSQDEAEVLNTLGLVGLGVGGAALVTGAVLLLLDGSGEPGEEAPALEAWLGQARGGVQVRVRF